MLALSLQLTIPYRVDDENLNGIMGGRWVMRATNTAIADLMHTWSHVRHNWTDAEQGRLRRHRPVR